MIKEITKEMLIAELKLLEDDFESDFICGQKAMLEYLIEQCDTDD